MAWGPQVTRWGELLSSWHYVPTKITEYHDSIRYFPTAPAHSYLVTDQPAGVGPGYRGTGGPCRHGVVILSSSSHTCPSATKSHHTATMSFSGGVGDLIILGTWTWTLYKNCKESSTEFQRISSEVASLHVVIKEAEEHINENQAVSPSRDARLNILIDGCKDVLVELEKLLNKYESLGTQAQRTWDRMRWGLEEVADVRSRIISNTTLLTAFNSNLARYFSPQSRKQEWANRLSSFSSSTTRIEKRLDRFIKEVRAGLREGSVVTSSDVADTIDTEDVWQVLRRELEDVGISAPVVEENHAYISNWLKTAITNGMLEETDQSRRPTIQGSIDSGYGGSGVSTADASGLVPITTTDEGFGTQSVQLSRDVSGTSTSMTKTDVKVRKASAVSSVLFKLFKKETAIIEAASAGDVSKVAKLVSAGANVNARDQWGVSRSTHLSGHSWLTCVMQWSALSMCAYGGWVEICRMLLDHGANLDNVDVDGDTPESLATNRGHAAVLIMLEEERAARDLKVREAEDEQPRR